MSPGVREQLSPQPFRQWCEWRLDPQGWEAPDPRPEEYKGQVSQLAFELGFGPRRLWRWRFEVKSLERIEVEDALRQAEVQLWEVYPDLDDPVDLPEEDTNPTRQSRLTEEQLRVLHAIHTQRKVSIRRLGEEVWKSIGYASPVSAARAIGRGFSRLGLEATDHGRETFGLRKCDGFTRDGNPCDNLPLAGEEFCYAHHPETRNKLRYHALSISPFVEAVA